MKTINKLKQTISNNIKSILDINLSIDTFNLDLPPNEKMGDYAFPCFDLAKKLKKSPTEVSSQLAAEFKIGGLIKQTKNIGPYLNIFVSNTFLQDSLIEISKDKNFGKSKIGQGQKILIEFSGPNTNKPQHIGHVRNDCLGQSLVNIYKTSGYKTVAVNIINDRGIHIVKSMLTWQKFADGETPKSADMKGDHLVGKYYVKFGQLLKEEQDKYFSDKNINLADLPNLEKKQAEEEFLQQSPLMEESRKMLIAWENNDPAVRKLWKMMNDWVYVGYDKTYKDLGIEFDHLDFESENYLLGKDIIEEGLKKKIFFKKEDGSVWIDLSDEGLDEKLVLRSDGTSVYITQDLGTAHARYKKFKFDRLIYVVANEQDYHFKVLFLILKKLGYSWADSLHHLSYGMFSLPGGKIKSREGKTADADELIATMIAQAKDIISKAEKKVATSEKEKEKIARIVGLGALKFFILGTNPQKNIVFKPEESISFDGYTGTFVQYTHARISTMLNKAGKISPNAKVASIDFNSEEKKLVKTLLEFPQKIILSANDYNPSILTQYLFDLAKTYNNFYQHHQVINVDSKKIKQARLSISLQTKNTLTKGLALLGIEAPEVM
ncbi:arginine--tRNA ligase [Candidatus Parcubacteria bacterium]|jgi:arginyl-tRNA synthetase|nr:arginine--tRNA ligase [Candidatus Parcubacteria bacterium]